MKIFNQFSVRCLLVCAFVVGSADCYGQLFKGEVLMGGTFSQVEGDMVKGYKKIGFCGGLGIQFPFHFSPNSEIKPWDVTMELLFVQRGAREKNRNYIPNDTIYGFATQYKFKYLLKFNYVCLPFMVHYTDKERYTIGVGLSYNRLVAFDEIEFDVRQTYDTVALFKPYDLMFVLDVRAKIWKQLKAGFRFEYSVTSIRTRTFQEAVFYDRTTRRQYNNTLSLYLTYIFNEKIKDTEKNKERKERIYYY
ncbi:MAG: PorT family protein [Lentimicrobiaceae bacterium]|nr:PorT family protein [Lentimicrobiaceae bacterium]